MAFDFSKTLSDNSSAFAAPAPGGDSAQPVDLVNGDLGSLLAAPDFVNASVQRRNELYKNWEKTGFPGLMAQAGWSGNAAQVASARKEARVASKEFLKPAERSWTETVTDPVIGATAGIVGFIKSGADLLGGEGGEFSNMGGKGIADLHAMQSDKEKDTAKMRAEQAAAIDARTDIGGFSKEALKGFHYLRSLSPAALSELVGSTLPGGGVARAVGAGGAALGVGEKVATGAGASLAGVIDAAGGGAGGAFDEVMKMTPKQLQASPDYRDLLKTLPPEQAKEALAHAAASRARLAGIPVGVLLGPLGAEAAIAKWGRPAGAAAAGSSVASTAKHAAGEAAEEGLTQAAQNYGVQLADPSLPLYHNTGPSAAAGALMGGVAGSVGRGDAQVPPVAAPAAETAPAPQGVGVVPEPEVVDFSAALSPLTPEEKRAFAASAARTELDREDPVADTARSVKASATTPEDVAALRGAHAATEAAAIEADLDAAEDQRQMTEHAEQRDAEQRKAALNGLIRQADDDAADLDVTRGNAARWLDWLVTDVSSRGLDEAGTAAVFDREFTQRGNAWQPVLSAPAIEAARARASANATRAQAIVDQLPAFEQSLWAVEAPLATIPDRSAAETAAALESLIKERKNATSDEATEEQAIEGGGVGNPAPAGGPAGTEEIAGPAGAGGAPGGADRRDAAAQGAPARQRGSLPGEPGPAGAEKGAGRRRASAAANDAEQHPGDRPAQPAGPAGGAGQRSADGEAAAGGGDLGQPGGAGESAGGLTPAAKRWEMLAWRDGEQVPFTALNDKARESWTSAVEEGEGTREFAQELMKAAKRPATRTRVRADEDAGRPISPAERTAARSEWDDNAGYAAERYGDLNRNDQVPFDDLDRAQQDEWAVAHRDTAVDGAQRDGIAQNILRRHARNERTQRVNAAAEKARAAEEGSNLKRTEARRSTNVVDAVGDNDAAQPDNARFSAQRGPNAPTQFTRDIDPFLKPLDKLGGAFKAKVDDLISRAADDGIRIELSRATLLDSVPEGRPDDSIARLRRLSSIFGVRIAAVETAPGNNFKFNGVHYRDLIWLATDAQHPMHVVFGHELLHDIAKKAPKFYAEIAKNLAPLIDRDAEYARRLGMPFATADQQSLVREEIIADIFGNRFGEPEFWAQLGQDQSFLKRFADYVVGWIDRIIGRKLDGDDFVSDLARAREVVLDAVALYADARAETDVDGSAKFSRKRDPGIPADFDAFAKLRSAPVERQRTWVSKAIEKFVNSYEAVRAGLGVDQIHPVMQTLQSASHRADGMKQEAVWRYNSWIKDLATSAKTMGLTPEQAKQAVDNLTLARYVASGANVEVADRYRKRVADIETTAEQHETERLAAEAKQSADEVLTREERAAIEYEAPASQHAEYVEMVEWLQKFDQFDDQVMDREQKDESGYNSVGGLTTAEAKAAVDATRAAYGPDRMQALNRLSDQLVALRQFVTDDLTKRGLYSDAQREGWTNNPLHVPTTGTPDAADSSGPVDAFGASMNSQALHKRRMGRMSLAEPTSDAIVRYLERGYSELAHTPFKQELEKLAKLPGSGVHMTSQAQATQAASGTRPVNYRQPVTDGETGRTSSRNMAFYFDDPAVGEAVHRQNMLWHEGPYTGALGTATRGLQWILTQGTIAFPVMSTFRDVGERMVKIATTEKLRDAQGQPVSFSTWGSILKGYSRFARGALGGEVARATFAFEFGQKYTETAAGRALRELHEAGAVSNYANTVGRTNAEMLANIKKQTGLSKMTDEARERLAQWSGAWEQQSSLIAYMMLRERGVSAQDSADAVRRSMDFRQQGTAMPGLRGMFMFLNPAVQGAYNSVQSLKTRKGVVYLATAISVSMLLQEMAASMGGDDDDDELLGDRADRHSSSEQHRSLIFYAGDTPVKVPVPYGITGLAWGMAVSWRRWQQGRDTAADAAGEVAQLALRELTGAPTSEVKFSEHPVLKVMRTITPAPLQGLLSVATGTNDFGSSLNRKGMSDDMPKAMQGKDHTPEAWKDMAEVLAKAGVNMTPEEVRALASTVLLGPLKESTDALTDENYRSNLLLAATGGTRVIGKAPKALESAYYARVDKAHGAMQRLNLETDADREREDDGRRKRESAAEFTARVDGSTLSDEDKALVIAYRTVTGGGRKKVDPDTMRQFLEETQE